MTEKTNYKTIVITAIATALGAAAGSYAVKDIFNTSLDKNDPLIKIAEEVNKTLPITLDSETRLDSTFGLNKTFTYNYTLTNYAYEDINIEQFKHNMETKLRNNYCTAEVMKQFLDKGVSVSFAYLGKEGKEILKLSYKPSDCLAN